MNNKLLLLYSDKTGHNKSLKLNKKITKKLSTKYDVVPIYTNTLEDFCDKIKNAKQNFDYLVVCGGDGTFNLTINILMHLDVKDRPILGYIPTGTVNDGGKSFGAYSVRSAINVILKGNVVRSDIGKFNDQYFLYVLACGQYSDISYVVPRSKKIHFGRFSYYSLAIKEAFKYRKIFCTVETEQGIYKCETPFVLIMNGLYVGGFPVNFSNQIDDGKFDIYLTKPGLFNGLLHFLFFKIKTKHIRSSFIKVDIDSSLDWCVDGERGPKGPIEISCLPKSLTIFSSKMH